MPLFISIHLVLSKRTKWNSAAHGFHIFFTWHMSEISEVCRQRCADLNDWFEGAFKLLRVAIFWFIQMQRKREMAVVSKNLGTKLQKSHFLWKYLVIQKGHEKRKVKNVNSLSHSWALLWMNTFNSSPCERYFPELFVSLVTWTELKVQNAFQVSSVYLLVTREAHSLHGKLEKLG